MKSFNLVKSTEPFAARPLRVVLFGLPGVGKTTLAFTMPKPVLHLDFDGGIYRAVQKIRPDFISFRSYGDFHNFLHSDDFDALIETEGFKTVVLDTVGALLDDFLAPWLIKEDPRHGNANGGLTLQGWGALGMAYNTIRTRFESLGLNMAMICHDKDEGDGQPKGLAVKGSTSDLIYRTSDLMGYVSVQGQNRVIEFDPTSLHVGKNITDLSGRINIPVADHEKYNDFLAAIIKRAMDGITKLSADQEKAIARLEELRELLQGVDNPKGFQEFAEIVAGEKEFIRAQIRQAMSDRMAATGIEYNKESKTFQPVEK